MCRLVHCPKCGRPTFAGCGAHVEEVLGHIPREERCQCNAKARDERTTAQPKSQVGRFLRDLWPRN